MSKHTFSIIIPCFNEVSSIEHTITEIRKTLTGYDINRYELIVVDDGSNDGSSELLDKISIQDEHLVVVTHAGNKGYGASLKTGIRNARGNYIVITDADGTYPIDRLPDLIEMAPSADMVVGSRTADDVTYPLIRKLPKILLKHYASWITNQEIPDINSGMRVFRRDLAKKFLDVLPDTFSFTTTITIALMTNNYCVIYEPINYYQRIGNSKIRPVHDTFNFVLLIMRTGSYFAPLRVFGPFAGILGLMGIASLVYDIFVSRNITDKTIIFFMFSMNTGMFSLLADMLHKKS